MKSVLFHKNSAAIYNAYDRDTLDFLKCAGELEPQVYSLETVQEHPEWFADTEYIFSTWGMYSLTSGEIRSLFPSLRCVFYAAGTVQRFARPFLECGVRVFSAWGANAIPVAEYAVCHIILANKGFYSASRLMSRGDAEGARAAASQYPGNYGETVGIIGAGQIGKYVIHLLKAYQLKVKVYDPFLEDETARELGVRKCSLEELFSSCSVISNHLANNAKTVGILDGRLFQSMRPYATFINTGRGAQVVEQELAAVLEARPDLTAVLDVTWPEPPEAGHPFYSLPNCVLSPHIAGSKRMEICRMGQFMAEEFGRYIEGKPCRYEISSEMLATMA